MSKALAKRAAREKLAPHRPAWQPDRLVKRSGGVSAEETQEEAWDRARNWVRHLVSIGIAVESIGHLMQPTCAPNTLRKYFQHELDYGKEHQTGVIAGTITRAAMNGDINAAKFWLERQAGWSNKLEANIGGVLLVRNIEGDELE